MTLKFNSGEEYKTVDYTINPVFHINKIILTTNDDWVSKLFSSSFIISITAFNEQGEEVGETKNQISIGSLISPNHRQPVFEVNKSYKFSESLIQNNIRKINNWVLKIELKDLILNENESLNVDFMDTNYIERRAEDWKIRVKNVIQDITDWLVGENDYEIRAAKKQRMEEGLMKSFNVPFKEIDSADIFKNGKMKATIKPFGLWVMGANGRIDLISEKGNFILVDHAEAFEQTQWKLHQKDNRQDWVVFDKAVLLNILSL